MNQPNDAQNCYAPPAPQESAPQQPAPRSRSAMGIVSLVLGIIALLISFLPIINNFAAILAVIGLIFGIIGIVICTRNKAAGRGLAIAGTILNALAFVIVIASQAAYSAAIDAALDQTTSQSISSSASPASAGTTSAASSTAESTAEAKYEVSIDSCRVTTDYSGAQAIVVSFTWTNNSDSDTSFMVAISDKAFQNGVQLDTAVVSDIDAQSALNQLKPGATSTVEQAFLLDDQSTVTVECSELISFSKEIIAEKTFEVA